MKKIVKYVLQTIAEGELMHLSVTIGQRIRTAREAVMLSVDELANMIAIEAEQMKAIEAGLVRPHPSLLYEISERLGHPVSFFLLHR
jgi:ribosome-binding protein aMBF1 (putative translation factor)